MSNTNFTRSKHHFGAVSIKVFDEKVAMGVNNLIHHVP